MSPSHRQTGHRRAPAGPGRSTGALEHARSALAWVDTLTVRQRLGAIGFYAAILLAVAFVIGGGVGLLLGLHAAAGAVAGLWLVAFAGPGSAPGGRRRRRAQRFVLDPITVPHGVADLLEAR